MTELTVISTVYTHVSVAAGAIPTVTLLLWLSVVPLELRYKTAVAAFVTANSIAMTREVMQRVALKLQRHQELVSVIFTSQYFLVGQLQRRN
jgi:hypothetical protein